MSVLSSVDLWQAVSVATIATVGAAITARPALRDIGLKRRLDTTTKFGELATRATNVGGDVGKADQVACIYLIASFGRDEKHLREPARAILTNIATWGRTSAITDKQIPAAATDALRLLPSAKVRRAATKVQTTH